MQLSCIHCGKDFSITKSQLGGSGRCPHCRAQIELPDVADDLGEEEEAQPAPVSHWWENSVSGLVSVVLHMVLMLILALIGYDAYTGQGLGEEVLIGELPTENLSEANEEEFSEESDEAESESEEFEEMELEPVATEESTAETSIAEIVPLTSGGSSGSFTVAAVSGGGMAGGGGSWNGLLQNLQRNGLDVVITFDATGSMGGEIREVKNQIKRIGSTLIKMVPKARIGVCSFRDFGDAYVVQGLPLTNDIQKLDTYLADVQADGGGDTPEAVHEGLKWTVTNNKFRRNARKVVLLFGDAPPHRQYYDDCLRIASDFQRQQKGVVSTVTCRRPVALREFEEIAQMGGGEAFLTANEDQIMTQLMILVFGSQYRGKVLEAFELMGR